MSVADYNTDPDSNTSISGINIAEGCPPSGINNAIRQMMADIKTADDANVKLSGAQTISGAKTFTDYLAFQNIGIINVQKSDNNCTLSLYGGGNYQQGAYATLKGIGQTSDPGSFSLTATDGGSNVKAFFGKPDGTLTWGGKDIITNGGDQTVAGVKTFTNSITEEASNPAVILNRTYSGSTPSNQSDLRFANNGNNEAEIRLTTTNDLQIGIKGSSDAWYGGPALFLRKDNTFELRSGYGSTTYKLVGSASGGLTWRGQTIQTSSDERLKDAFSTVPDAVLDAWGEVNWQQFKYRDAIAEKGVENCRWHPGLVAQRVKAVFEKEGLDACAYGILCHDVWEDEYDDDGNLVRPAGDMWTIRYEEALAMEAAYQRRRAYRAETRLADIEARLSVLEAKA